MIYGNNIAKYVRNNIAKVGPGGWTRLVSAGSVPLPNRQWIKVQAKGRNSLAIAYTNKNSDGTFTAPTTSAHPWPHYPANTVLTEPVSADVMLWGRCQPKAGASDGGLRVSVTEFA